MSQTSCVKTFHSTCNLDTHMKMREPRAFLVGRKKLVAQMSRSKPFAFFFFSFEGSGTKEKMFLIGWTHNT